MGKHALGFEIRRERVELVRGRHDHIFLAYNENGECVGDKAMAEAIYSRGIKPELASPSAKICTVGFCGKEQKWYGWSHRAIIGFGIGDMLFDPDFICDESVPFTRRGTIPIRFLEDAYLAARRFAKWIS